jgi:hypothetical protein
MAAAFLVALGIGLFARTARHDDGRQPQQLAANPQPQPNAQGPTLASAPALPSSAPAVAPPGGSPWKTVTVSLNDGGGQRQIRLPAAQREQLDPAWLEQPMALPAEFQELQETLRAAGCRIEQSRRLVPLPMQDGGRLVVPVDQVEVRYVGDNQYK